MAVVLLDDEPRLADNEYRTDVCEHNRAGDGVPHDQHRAGKPRAAHIPKIGVPFCLPVQEQVKPAQEDQGALDMGSKHPAPQRAGTFEALPGQ